jgi:hypothetical protein
MTPPLAPELFRGLLMSGSSDAGLARPRAVCTTAVHYPKPAKVVETNEVPNGDFIMHLSPITLGIRVNSA